MTYLNFVSVEGQTRGVDAGYFFERISLPKEQWDDPLKDQVFRAVEVLISTIKPFQRDYIFKVSFSFTFDGAFDVTIDDLNNYGRGDIGVITAKLRYAARNALSICAAILVSEEVGSR